MNIHTRDEIRAAYRQGEEAIIQLFEWLIQELQAQQDRLNKNSGGLQGHKGHTLEPSENPVHTEVHKVGQCAMCGVTLEDQFIPLECISEFFSWSLGFPFCCQG